MVHQDVKILHIIAKLSPALTSATYYEKDLDFWPLLSSPCPYSELSIETVFYISIFRISFLTNFSTFFMLINIYFYFGESNILRKLTAIVCVFLSPLALPNLTEPNLVVPSDCLVSTQH